MRIQRRAAKKARIESAAITIDKESRIFLKRRLTKPRPAFCFASNSPRMPICWFVINADDGVEHGRVVEVRDIARGANVARMAIAVKPKESRGD